uniref:ATP synthase complex subunit 8 n=1 Tax=Xylosandrus morigerus TaxID=195578 RepID=A0A343A657_9CUCU|nr:ATP synthase F0 subunit 8 [Xylosandrus morigerus]AOY40036.1 ATP synthase F0 subunit 8 [Xylosandrus morigerus]
MPQMAPLAWISLFIFFTILFFITCIINFFMFSYSPKYEIIKTFKNLPSWKW